MPSTGDERELAVGDSDRAIMALGIRSALTLSASFLAFIWIAKEVPALYLHEPWQSDPYDAMISFSFVAIPLLVGPMLLRLQLCTRHTSLPVRRVADLLRLSWVLVGTIGVTLGFQWTSVFGRADLRRWTPVTVILIAVLALATLATVAVAKRLGTARRALRRVGVVPTQPDWLADAVALGELGARRLGPWRRPAERLVAWCTSHPIHYIRRHPLRSTALASIAVAVVTDSPQVILEHYSVGLAVYFLAVSACSYFAFVTIVGSRLRMIEHGDRARYRSSSVVVAVCASVPLTASFRTALWWVLGTDDANARLPQLVELTVVGAAVAALIALAVSAGRSAAGEPRRDDLA